ncbi:MAG: RloB domain-containing protein, partial [Pseudonocardiaceae bacterium]
KCHLRNPAVQVKVRAKGRAPEDLVRYARCIAPEGADEFDQVWCVVDSDEYDLELAASLAAALDVRLAVSNRASSCGCCCTIRTAQRPCARRKPFSAN